MKKTKPVRTYSIRKVMMTHLLLSFFLFSLLVGGIILILRLNHIPVGQIQSPGLSEFFGCLICLLIAFSTSYVLMRQTLTFVEQLSHATREISEGNYNVQVTMHTTIEEINDMIDSFNTMVKELNSVEMMRNDFIADVSHEFKTPLSSITGYVTLLQDPELTEAERNEYIQMAILNADKLNDLTANILRISKLENQGMLPEPVIYRLDEQIREAIVMLYPKWNEKNLNMEIDMPPLTYCGQRDLIFQIWMNLITNAIKFSEEGGSIFINMEENQQEVRVVIHDQGIGMSAETLQHIFEKFYQADTSRKSQGNGLGLPLCKQILDKCGGRMDVSSTPGKGTVFTVILFKE